MDDIYATYHDYEEFWFDEVDNAAIRISDMRASIARGVADVEAGNISLRPDFLVDVEIDCS
jgi:hypothetical protein